MLQILNYGKDGPKILRGFEFPKHDLFASELAIHSSTSVPWGAAQLMLQNLIGFNFLIDKQISQYNFQVSPTPISKMNIEDN